MMEKLMVDSIVLWAKHYKVDGFRFDIMGFHLKSNMLKVRAALDALTLKKDGVDGRSIYVYGEAWNFGVMANNGRGENAIQVNLASTGIGSFSDRIRDAVRGGGPFSPRRDQGFATGLFVEPNGTFGGSAADAKAELLRLSDLVRLGLAGNIASYEFVDRFGNTVRGSDVDYFGMPGAYGGDPSDTIQYIGVHDDTDWFDTMNIKLNSLVPRADRMRMHRLGLSIVALSQGVPFFHAGDEILRSKSGDRNSYNSGDWFNRIDWTLESNHWGAGLPPANGNQDVWDILAPGARGSQPQTHGARHPRHVPAHARNAGDPQEQPPVPVTHGRRDQGVHQLLQHRPGSGSRTHRRAHPELQPLLLPRAAGRGAGERHTAATDVR